MEKEKKTTILFLSWRDIKSPNMGGAEIFTHEMMKNADLSRFEFIHFSPIYEGLKPYEVIDTITYIRDGSLLSVIFKAGGYYKKNKNKIDFVVDQCNTFRFFTKFWVEGRKRIFLIYQLTREIWDFHMSFPLNKIGKALETPMLKLNKNDYTLTESQSTKDDLVKVGFDEEKVSIIPIGLSFTPWDNSEFCKKETDTTFIYVGRFARYKGIDDSIHAFGEYRNKYDDAKFWIVGKRDKEYIESVLMPICREYGLSCEYASNETNEQASCESDVTFFGFVDKNTKLDLMSRAHIQLVPSIREGWGLIVTEAAAVGTPSITYNSPGLSDAVDFGKAGYMTTENNIHGLFKAMEVAISDNEGYNNMQKSAHEFSKKFNWKHTGNAFNSFMESII